MPSLSASVPANKLKVMRPGKPVARKVPYQAAAGGMSTGSTGSADSAAGAGVATASPAKGAGISRADGRTATNGWTSQTAAPPKLTIGGGFRTFPRDTVGGPMVPGNGPGGGAPRADIQTAIQSLRGQLGMPLGMPTVEPGTDQDVQTSVSTAPEPAWKRLAGMGVGGQGSPAANRAKLAELLAARTGGGMMPPGTEPGVGAPNAQANPVVADAANAYIRRLPATISDPSGSVGGAGGMGGATLAGNQGPMGPGPTAPAGPGQNPYMDILNRRFGGFGGFGSRGLNPMAAGAGQYAG